MNDGLFPLIKPLLKDIKPSGFYLKKLESCASGLTGNIGKYFDDLNENNAWRGGTGEAWERGPYYVDGLISLALLLNNDNLSLRMEAWIKPILDSSKPDGGFGPEYNRDVWPRLVALKAIRTYHENLHDDQAARLILHFLDTLKANLEGNAPVLWAWARLPEVGAVLDMVGPADKRKRIYDSVVASSLDWTGYFKDFRYERTTTHYLNKPLFNLVFSIMKVLAAKQTNTPVMTLEEATKFNHNRFVQHFLKTHGVNIAMAMKYPVYERFFGDGLMSDDELFNGIDELLVFHGNSLGIFSSDEHLNGTDPRQGVELCTIVESLFSMEEILRFTGDPRAADYIELWAYNALLAICTPDMTAHQYVMQPNQTKAGYKRGPFFDVGRSGTAFGIAPHFGCCAANMHQGWPKLVNSAVLYQNEELFVFSYLTGKYSFETKTGPVDIAIEGNYPFGDQVIISAKSTTDVPKTLHLRIPFGAETDAEINHVFSSYINKRMIEIKFEGYIQVRLTFKFMVTTIAHGKTISLRRGPLVYAFPIPSRERYLKGSRPFHDRAFIPEGPVKKPIIKINSQNMIKVVDMGLLPSHQERYPGIRYLEVKTAKGIPIRLIPLGVTALRISQFAFRKES
jgi:hypothetical protein